MSVSRIRASPRGSKLTWTRGRPRESDYCKEVDLPISSDIQVAGRMIYIVDGETALNLGTDAFRIRAMYKLIASTTPCTRDPRCTPPQQSIHLHYLSRATPQTPLLDQTRSSAEDEQLRWPRHLVLTQFRCTYPKYSMSSLNETPLLEITLQSFVKRYCLVDEFLEILRAVWHTFPHQFQRQSCFLKPDWRIVEGIRIVQTRQQRLFSPLKGSPFKASEH